MKAVRSSLLLLAALFPAAILADATVTFDSGTLGWSGPQGPGGATVVEPTGGNPGANLHTVFNNFGITFSNTTNPDFVGDYTDSRAVTLAIDLRVHLIEFFGSPVSRPWLVELRDYDDPPGGYPYVSVWYKFADVASATHGSWTTFSVTIADTAAEALPPGWGGTGAEDPKTFEPELPPDRTFTSVLAGVDEIAYTTFEPGFVFGFTDFDVRLDNISIVDPLAVPGDTVGLALAKAPNPATVVLSWQPSCGSSALDYGIYEGVIGNWYDHKRIDCSDAGANLSETVTAGAGNRYYLVVPLAADEEGSYGVDAEGNERPPAPIPCRAAQDVSPCR